MTALPNGLLTYLKFILQVVQRLIAAGAIRNYVTLGRPGEIQAFGFGGENWELHSGVWAVLLATLLPASGRGWVGPRLPLSVLTRFFPSQM